MVSRVSPRAGTTCQAAPQEELLQGSSLPAPQECACAHCQAPAQLSLCC